MLTFVGLGLHDEHSVTVEGREAVTDADRVFAERYTSRLTGTTLDRLESFHGTEIEVCDRDRVERDPEPILAAAEDGDVCFLAGGDAMVATTHVDLRLRAIERGIGTRVIHGTSAASAAAGLTGLQNYRFGKAVTLPFPRNGGDGVPPSVVESIDANGERGLHTLVYLDIAVDGADDRGGGERFMTGDVAAGLLAEGWRDGPGVVVARAGSDDPTVAADRLSALAERSFGDPLHLLVVPGDLHHVEREALEALAGAPPGFGQSASDSSGPSTS